jgi:hypothetical protein
MAPARPAFPTSLWSFPMIELELPEDYSDLLLELLDAGAEFVVVGGWAVAVHGHGRATDDLDILVRPTPENAEKIYRALERFGGPLVAHGVPVTGVCSRVIMP